MKTLTLEVPPEGLFLRLSVNGVSPAQIVLTLPEEVRVTLTALNDSVVRSLPDRSRETILTYKPVSPMLSRNEFPPRKLIEDTIIQILKEHGGAVKIRDEMTGWNIYDEVAARLGVSIEARRRLTRGTAEPAWRPEVGYARKNLEQRGIIKPTSQSGRGVWELVVRPRCAQ